METRRKAMLDFGGEERFKEQARDAGSTRPIEDILMDLRFCFRQLHRRLGFAVVALLTLALGIGANTAIFGIVAGVLISLTVSHTMTSLLWGVSPTDPEVLMVAAVVLTSSVLAAAYVPSRRVARLDPATVLRGS